MWISGNTQTKKQTCQHVGAQRGVMEKLKMNPCCTHKCACAHPHPLPSAPTPPPPLSWVSEWEIKFFWWESFSCPYSSPPSLSSHPFFNLFAYLWTINLCTQREISSCAVKCSGCCRAHNRWSSLRDWRESHKQKTHEASHSQVKRSRRCISAGTKITVHHMCTDDKLPFGFSYHEPLFWQCENRRCVFILIE